MGNENDLSGKVGLDTTAFKAGVTQLSAQIKTIETNFKASAAMMDNWSGTTEGLQSKITSLTGRLDLQKKQLSLLQDAYKKTVDEQGADSKAAQSLATQMFDVGEKIKSTQNQVNKYSDSLSKMKQEAEKSQSAVGKLTSTINSQQSELSQLKEKYTNTALSQGKSSASAKDLAKQIQSLSSQLNENKTKLSNAKEETDKYDSSLKKAGKSTSDFKGKSSDLGGTLKGGLASGAKIAAAGIAAAGAAMVVAATAAVKMFKSSVENADELQKLSDTTGQSAEELQKMRYVGSAVGVSLDTMTSAHAKLTKSMNASKSASSAQAKAFSELGIKTTDANGQLRNSNDVFNEAIGALGGVKNSTERDAMAMQIFGKSAMELNPLIKAGSKGIAEMSAEAEKSGAIMSNDAVAGLDALGDKVDGMKLSLKGMAGTLSASLLPVMDSFIGSIQNVTTGLNTAIKTGDYSQLGTAISGGLTSAISGIAADVQKFVPVVVQILNAVIGALVVAIPAILPALANGIVQIISATVGVISQNAQLIMNAAVQVITILATSLIQLYPQIIQAGINLLVSLMDGITRALPQLIPVIINVVLQIVNTLTNPDNLTKLITSGIQLVFALANGLIKAIPQLLSAAPIIIKNVVQALIKLLPQLIPVALNLITTLATGLITFIPELLTYLPQIISAIIGAFKDTDWGKIGKNIIEGLIKGLKDMVSNLGDAIGNICSSIKDTFKNLLGIHSPSRVTREFGVNLVKGLANGMTDNISLVKSAVNQLSGAAVGLDGGINVGVSSISRNYSDAGYRAAYATAATQDTSSSVVVATLVDIFDKLVEMSKQGIYLDGKTLVGGIAEEMGDELNRITARRARA